MKRWMGYILIVGLTAATASAAWWPFGSKDKEELAEPAPPPMEKPQRMHRGEEGMHRRDGERRLSPEQQQKLQKMRQERSALMALGEAARNETDPVKKEQLVAELRVKLNEVADKMAAAHQKRLKQAAREIEKLKERAAEMEANRDQRIEEQIQRILDGKPMGGPQDGEGKRRMRPEGGGKKHRDMPPPEEL